MNAKSVAERMGDVSARIKELQIEKQRDINKARRQTMISSLQMVREHEKAGKYEFATSLRR